MGDNAKALSWSANDYSDNESKISQMAIRFKTEEDCESFKTAFNAACEFNVKAKTDCEDKDLVWADAIEDKEEEKVDDIENNTLADENN